MHLETHRSIIDPPFPDADVAALRLAIKHGQLADISAAKLERMAGSVKDISWTTIVEATHDDDIRAIKQVCYLVEALDYYGRWDLARRVVSGAEPVVGYLLEHNWRASTATRRLAFREKIRLAAVWTRATLYRGANDQAAASATLGKLIDQVETRLKVPDFPCHRTLAQLRYYLGRSLRQRGLFENAEDEFRRAVEHYSDYINWGHDQDRAEARGRSAHRILGAPKLPTEEDLAEARYKMAVVVGLGIGWIAGSRGQLSLARSNVAVARGLVPPSDLINDAFLDMLDASFLVRASRGGLAAKRVLAEARRKLLDARRLFKNVGHRLYHARAMYELAFAAFMVGDLEEARLLAQRLLGLERDPRVGSPSAPWPVYARNLLSRIHLKAGNSAAALAQAKAALRLADARDARAYLSIGPLLSMAEVKMNEEDWVSAIDHVIAAMNQFRPQAAEPDDERRRNPQLEATCEFYLARCHHRLGYSGEAETALGRAQALAAGIEIGHVQRLAESVTAEVQPSDFIARASLKRVKHDAQIMRLENWLVERGRAIVEKRDGPQKKSRLIRKIATEIGWGRDNVTAVYGRIYDVSQHTRALSSPRKPRAGSRKRRPQKPS